jgi:pimeloyl-ACP methyl ester carboxylesterase
MSAVQRHTIHANALDHSVLEWPPQGTGKGSVLLLHGYMDAAATWRRVAESLASEGLRVFALDQRGFGEGARVREGGYYHFPDYVFDVADVAEALSPNEPLAVVGHSMGGTVASLYTGTFPSRVLKLAVLEGVGPPDNSPDVAPDRMRAWIDQTRLERSRPSRSMTADEALGRLAIAHPNVEPELLREPLEHLVRHAGEGRVTWKYDALHRTRSPMPFFAKVFEAFARRVTCPVLFVSGGPHGYHPPDEEDRLASFVQLVRAEIADAGHMMHWTRPNELSAVLSRFLLG